MKHEIREIHSRYKSEITGSCIRYVIVEIVRNPKIHSPNDSLWICNTVTECIHTLSKAKERLESL